MQVNARVNWLFWQRLYGWPVMRSVAATLIRRSRGSEWRNRTLLGAPMLVPTAGDLHATCNRLAFAGPDW